MYCLPICFPEEMILKQLKCIYFFQQRKFENLFFDQCKSELFFLRCHLVQVLNEIEFSIFLL